jgi:class 3 adenylate cyclase
VIREQQLPQCYREVINEQISIYNDGRSVQVINRIPDTQNIPIENPRHWLRIPDVICVFVDMLGSTKLSAEAHDNSTAGAYQLFTGTAVKLLSAFEPPYIDVRGDGVFALFDSVQSYRALAAAVTFKTFAKEEFVPRIREKTGQAVGSHLGIDQKTVLVRKLGFKRYGGRTDRQNEVWAGKPVNMAAKLASISEDNELLVSERFFKNIQHELVLRSCGCVKGIYTGEKTNLWTEKDVSNDSRFDFDKVWILSSNWCCIHGREYCESILKLNEV